MSNFMNNLEYDITSESEITRILSHFDTDQILDLVEDSIQRRYASYPNNPLNLVHSIETNFSIVYANLPSEKERIDELRDRTYSAIIDKLAYHYNFEYNDNGQDYYTIAYYLYEFLVSGFSTNMINIFTNYILRQKEYIYNQIGLINMKKNKDMSTIYTKRIHNDPKLALINANLEYVIDSISLFDIPLIDVLKLIYTDNNIIELLSQAILPKGDIFKDYFVATLNNEYKPVYITNIKFALMEVDKSTTETMHQFLQQA